jgi:hypothetical protein
MAAGKERSYPIATTNQTRALAGGSVSAVPFCLLPGMAVHVGIYAQQRNRLTESREEIQLRGWHVFAG